MTGISPNGCRARQPAGEVPVGPSFPSSPLRFRRIEVDGGRINFKHGDEKLPFAFVGVTGNVETDRPGRWRMNLDATPWRAAVVLQQVGTIHLSGDLGGTSSRLRPAALDVSWNDASLSDVLRLARRDDDGIRGALALSVNARTRDQGWRLGHSGARAAPAGPSVGSRASPGHSVTQSRRAHELESLRLRRRIDRSDSRSAAFERARHWTDPLGSRGIARPEKVPPVASEALPRRSKSPICFRGFARFTPAWPITSPFAVSPTFMRRFLADPSLAATRGQRRGVERRRRFLRYDPSDSRASGPVPVSLRPRRRLPSAVSLTLRRARGRARAFRSVHQTRVASNSPRASRRASSTCATSSSPPPL